MATTTSSATVEVLTAEVRVLMVGSRQVTLSVFRQLDWVEPDACQPLGRVNDERSSSAFFFAGLVVGRHVIDGTLVRARFPYEPMTEWEVKDLRSFQQRRDALLQHEQVRLADLERRCRINLRWQHAKPVYDALPLIVLAGLK